MRTAAGYGQPEPLGAMNPYAQVPSAHASGRQDPLAEDNETSIISQEKGSNIARAKLSVLSGEQAGEEWYLNRVNTSLGRALENDIILLDIASSRKHAQLIRHAEGFTLLDLQSANGIYINQRRISEEEIYDGDIIEIGETQVRFDTVDGPPRIRPNVYSQTFMGRRPQRSAPHAELRSGALRSAQLPEPALPPTPAPPALPPTPAPPALPAQDWRAQRPREQSAPPVSLPHTHQLAAPINPKQTYGFGSQMTPEQLTLSQKEQHYYLQSPGAISPLNKLRQRIDDLINLARFGRGRAALVMRLTLILTSLLVCFLIGSYLRHLGSSWTASSNSVASRTPTEGSTLNSRQTSGVGATTNSQLNDPNHTSRAVPNSNQSSGANMIAESGRVQPQQTTTLLKLTSELSQNGRWGELLTTLETQLTPTQRTQPWAKSLRDQAERGLIQQEIPRLKDALRRGQLKRVFREFPLLFARLSPEAQATLSYFDYALWLYRRELKGAERVNPPYSEQRMFKRAAQEVAERQKTSAKRTLRRAQVARARRALVKLRLEALTTNHPRRKLELAYLLGDPRDAHLLLEHYNSEIREGVKSGNYKTIAPLIEGGIKLARRHPRTLKSLLSTQRQLKAGALKWFGDARSLRTRKPNQARIFLEAALPYLDEPQRKEAAELLRRLK